ncbi:MAG TPA: transglycosylase SLT domain-containing protein [Methylomirabilota bacterium]|jgi:membrane-bound lytic murein transglycosylase D|nr:transglycosylase SLT domain-containing protein [Methylomirabilota bacterium]
MAKTQSTSTRTFLTGIAVLLAGCLAFAGSAQAEVEATPIAMAVDHARLQIEGPSPAAWSMDQPPHSAKYSDAAWADVFGEPAETPIVQPASFTPSPGVVPIPVVAMLSPARPVAAYRVHVNEHVRFFLDRFQTGYRRAVVEGWLARSGRYLPMILDVFRQKGLPEDLVFTVMIESGFNPVAVSHAGAKGLWQFMAPTARLYGLRVDGWLDERLDPEKSTVAAANYLRDLYAQFGSWDLAQAAYNTGDGRIQQAIDRTGSRDFWRLHKSPLLPDETKNFVPAIHAATLIGRQPERYGFSVVPEEPLRYEQVTVPKGSRLVRLAALSGVAAQELESLNPELRQKQTPPDGPYELKVPLGTTAAVRAAVEIDASAVRKIGPAPRPGVHVVQAGDTVWRIAKRYGVSAKQLVAWNGLDRPDRIFPGERLRVGVLGSTS